MRMFLTAHCGNRLAVTLALGAPANAAAISFKADLTGAKKPHRLIARGRARRT